MDPSVVGPVGGGAQTCRTGKLLPQPPELTSDNGRRVVTSGGGGRICVSGWQWRGHDNFIGFYYHLSLEYLLIISPPSLECSSFSNPLCEWRRVFLCVLMRPDEDNNCISGHHWTPDTRSSVIILSAPTHWVGPGYFYQRPV